VPAAFNGLWGFRARPRDPWVEQCFPLSPSFDTAGWFTTTAEDMISVQRAIFGAPVETAKRGFVRLAARELAPEMDEAFAASLDDKAARLAEPLPDIELAPLRRALDGALKAYVVIQSSEAAVVHAAWLDTHKAEYDPVVWARIDSGRRWTANDIAVAHAKQAEVRNAFAAILARHDGVVLPAAPFAALTKADCTDENRVRILRLTHAASLAAAPVLTKPEAMPDGTTGGLQIVLPDYHTAASEQILLASQSVVQ
jgi:amidase/aspartyl-tRNA(Asn)/glutamyl-tRNA(Gln) amidotransferase subunit A